MQIKCVHPTQLIKMDPHQAINITMKWSYTGYTKNIPQKSQK